MCWAGANHASDDPSAPPVMKSHQWGQSNDSDPIGTIHRADENSLTNVPSSFAFRSDTARYSRPAARHRTKWYPLRVDVLGDELAPSADDNTYTLIMCWRRA